MLKVNEYGGRQAKVNEKRQCFKGWETLVNPNALKHKLMISLISISAVHLLETFVAENIDTQHTIMQISIHIVFVLSALGITYMDKIGHTQH